MADTHPGWGHPPWVLTQTLQQALIDFNWSNRPIVFSCREQCVLLRVITRINLKLTHYVEYTFTLLGATREKNNFVGHCVLFKFKHVHFPAAPLFVTHTQTHAAMDTHASSRGLELDVEVWSGRLYLRIQLGCFRRTINRETPPTHQQRETDRQTPETQRGHQGP